MLSSLTFSRPLRLTILFLTCISTLFILLHTFYNAHHNSLAQFTPWPQAEITALTGESLTNRNETLGVAAQIYVISLQSRIDRRAQMEILREALGLQWTYVDGVDAGNEIIGKIMDSVRAIRVASSSRSSSKFDLDTNSGSGASFVWPEDPPGVDDPLDLWDPKFLDTHNPNLANSTGPMLCATQNDTIVPYDPASEPPEYRLLTHARIACWHSHLKVIQRIANDPKLNDTDAAIVLEDDVDMERDIQKRLEYLWTFLPSRWDIVYLGHCWSNETSLPALNAHSPQPQTHTPKIYIHPSAHPSCTHAYALSRVGARRLLLHLRYAPFAYSRAVDGAMAWLIRSGRIRSFSVVPSVVVQRKIARSDVMRGVGSAWKESLEDGIFSPGPGSD